MRSSLYILCCRLNNPRSFTCSPEDLLSLVALLCTHKNEHWTWPGQPAAVVCSYCSDEGRFTLWEQRCTDFSIITENASGIQGVETALSTSSYSWITSSTGSRGIYHTTASHLIQISLRVQDLPQPHLNHTPRTMARRERTYVGSSSCLYCYHKSFTTSTHKSSTNKEQEGFLGIHSCSLSASNSIYIITAINWSD